MNEDAGGVPAWLLAQKPTRVLKSARISALNSGENQSSLGTHGEDTGGLAQPVPDSASTDAPPLTDAVVILNQRSAAADALGTAPTPSETATAGDQCFLFRN